jgi:SAM-dependent methyltransferase
VSNEIPSSEVRFESPYQIDDVGRVFRWRDHIYRGIGESAQSDYRRLLASPDLGAMFEAGLVETEIVPQILPPYSMVVKHRTIPFPSYCEEWNVEMLRDAALTTIDLSERLLKSGYTIKDAHPWNILFDGSRPCFVDLGSVVSRERQPAWPYSAFRLYFLFPVLMIAAGFADLIRALQARVFPTLNLGDVTRLLLGRIPSRTLWRIRRVDRWLLGHATTPDAAYFQRLRDLMGEIPYRLPTTEWTEYESIGEREGLEEKAGWPPKLKSVDEVLRRLRPQTVLEVGCNKGWFSKLAAGHGASVIATDIDEPSLVTLYRECRARQLPITPLLMDICQPAPVHGLGGIYRAAHDRLKADGVLSLATIHHLVLKQGMTFEAVSRLHAEFAKRWLLIEFIPAEDRHVQGLIGPRTAWYCREGLCRALRPYFKDIQILASSPAPREYLLCTK